jgi:general secretion pathway protein G
MKITKKLRKSKGFTLVELLIVIIIIGILAGMMMLATGAATDKAEATKIVSNMRNIKAAAIMAYADGAKWADLKTSPDAVSKYLDQKDLVGGSADYAIAVTGSGDATVVFEFDADTTDGVQKKLKDMEDDSSLKVTVGTSAIMPIN